MDLVDYLIFFHTLKFLLFVGHLKVHRAHRVGGAPGSRATHDRVVRVARLLPDRGRGRPRPGLYLRLPQSACEGPFVDPVARTAPAFLLNKRELPT